MLGLSGLNHAALLDASPNPYLVLDRRLHIAGANRAYLSSVGRSLADIVGRWAWDAFPADPETVRQSVASFERVIRTGQPDTMALLRFDVPRPAAEGGGFEERWWSITHAPVFGADGTIEFVLQHPIDVTELRHLQGEMERTGTASPPITPAQSGIFARARSVSEANLTLKDESDRLNAMFAQAPGFMALLRGPEHQIVLANPGYIRLVGHRPVVGRTVAEALPEAVKQGYLALLDRVYRTGEAYAADGARFALEDAPGRTARETFVDFVYQPLRDAAGAVTGIFVQGVDMTARTQAEARRSALVRLTDAIRGGSDPTDLAHAAAAILGETIGVSRVGYGTIDHDAETLTVGRDWTAAGTESLAGTLRARDYGFLIDVLKQGEFFSIADAALDPRASNGAAALIARSARSFVNFPVMKGGRLVALFFVNHAEARDWSAEDLALIREFAERTRTAVERLQADATLRTNEARNRQILDSAADYAILATDLDGRVTRWNEGARCVLGWEEGEMLKESLDRIFTPEDRAAGRPDEEMREALATGRGVDERWHLRKSGERFWAVGKVTPLRDGSGTAVGFVKVLSDRTAQRRAEEELRELNATLESRVEERTAELREREAQLHQAQKMEAIGQLTGGLAHDVNNMLQGIGGALQMLEKRLAAGRLADVPHLLKAGREGVDRAASLTHRLLAFARRGRLDVKPVIVDGVVAGMADLIRRTVGPGIDVGIRLHDGDWTVRLDPNGLESALLNLAINARDAMPNGGRLTFSTGEVRLSAADLGADAEGVAPGDFVLVSVADTGEGMPPDVVARVFEPFFTTKPIGKGTGLGLSQLYGFVRQSGGIVRIGSEVGQGTMVRLYLPRGEAAAAVTDRLPAPAEILPDAAGRTVLLVEDESAVRTLVAEALRDRGYAVLEAEDGPAGLAALAGTARVDLLVTDVGLPGLNGRQLAEAARERRPALPVLFITGYAGTLLNGDLPSGMAAIAKPFSLDDLTSRAAAMLVTSEHCIAFR
ncbi:PAS domain-containing protein [Muricoccus nepalensis]|uniref:PAS domain-containing protein n=1 Tax=Muricoccus nepalensis TaxID=1854500 RepID=UPI00112CA780|nr:PAS domain-containing protein [Roseomonas nepalensis]